jgi:hypothetical protein
LTISVNDNGAEAERDAKTRATKETGIVLEYAHVNTLTAILGKSPDGKTRLYPKPLHLRFAEIKWWNFKPSSPKDGEDYIQLLRGDDNLQRHTFRSIEQNLFNQGQEDAADEVHKEMRRQLREQRSRRLREQHRKRLRDQHNSRKGFLAPLRQRFIRWVSEVWDRFMLWLSGVWDGLTASNTSPWGLVWVVAAWFLVSLWLFYSPANVAPSAEGLAVYKSQGVPAPSHPPAGTGQFRRSIWLALRYHVPVARFTAQDEWQPAKDARMTVPGLGRLPLINAEDYANIVLVLHWMAWPVILLLFSRKFFRRVEK